MSYVNVPVDGWSENIYKNKKLIVLFLKLKFFSQTKLMCKVIVTFENFDYDYDWIIKKIMRDYVRLRLLLNFFRVDYDYDYAQNR